MQDRRKPPTDIRGGGGAAEWRVALGTARLGAFVEAQANVDAQQMFLTMAMPAVAMANYTDEAIDHALEDVADFERSAVNMATVARQLLDEWRNQRRRAEAQARDA